MLTAAKAFLLFLTTIVLLLLTLLWLSPFCFYKMDSSGGYVLCVSLIKELSPMLYRKTDELSGSYNNFNDQKNLIKPPVIIDQDVVKLSEENFSHTVAKNRHVMVSFYAPRLHWSEKLAPEYAAAATQLKGKVVLAKVDALTEIKLANKWGIKAYPTIYFFVDGVRVDTYCSDRKRDAIVNWIKKKIAGAVYTVMTTEQTEHLLMAQSTIVLGFFDSLEGLETEELAAASKLHPDVTFYQTASADVARMFQIDPEIKRPALVLLEKEAKRFRHFDGPFTKSAMADFVSVKKHPLMTTFTKKNAPLIVNSPVKQLWLFALTHDSEVKSIFQEAAEAFKGKLLFVYVQMDCPNGGRGITEYFGITSHAPRVIAFNGILNPNKYVLNGELTTSTIKTFGLNFMEDKFAEPECTFRNSS